MLRNVTLFASLFCLSGMSLLHQDCLAKGKANADSFIRCEQRQDSCGGQSVPVALIMIGINPFARVPGQQNDPTNPAMKRGGTIKTRLEILASRVSELSQNDIVTQPESAGEYSVRVPKFVNGGTVITADKYFAKQCRLSPKKLATKLKNDLWVYIRGKQHSPLLGPKTAEEFFADGMQAYDDSCNTNLTDEQRAKRKQDAENAFQSAVDKKTDYPAAWLKLCSIQIERGENDKAKKTLEAIDALIKHGKTDEQGKFDDVDKQEIDCDKNTLGIHTR